MVQKTQTAEKAAETNTSFFRLDPYGLQDRIVFNKGDMTCTLDRTGVSVKMNMPKSGLPLSFALPARSFKGIAAKAVENADGSQTVSLELHHSDPALCIPVLIAQDLNDIAADWHSWSRFLKLPMLIIGADGMSQPVRDELGMVMLESPIARRKRITAYKPRSWFLKRRKVGVVGPIVKITSAEIIARV
ncbi:MAG: DUF6101 family protein [Salaquimonas sp.]